MVTLASQMLFKNSSKNSLICENRPSVGVLGPWLWDSVTDFKANLVPRAFHRRKPWDGREKSLGNEVDLKLAARLW